jgi:hypothetical protein
MKQLLSAFLVAGSLMACQASANPAHGKEGHTCDATCMAKHPATLKDHVCTDACKNGNHVYVHGEKGHACTDACKNQSSN